MKKKNVMICLSEEAIVKMKSLAKKEKRSASGLIESLIFNDSDNKQTLNRYQTITGDVKDLPSLKFITLVKHPDQFPELNDIEIFISNQKGIIEVNNVLYMNSPSSITDFIGEYVEKVAADLEVLKRIHYPEEDMVSDPLYFSYSDKHKGELFKKNKKIR